MMYSKIQVIKHLNYNSGYIKQNGKLKWIAQKSRLPRHRLTSLMKYGENCRGCECTPYCPPKWRPCDTCFLCMTNVGSGYCVRVNKRWVGRSRVICPVFYFIYFIYINSIYTVYNSRHNKYIWYVDRSHEKKNKILSKVATQWRHYKCWFLKVVKWSLHHLHFKRLGGLLGIETEERIWVGRKTVEVFGLFLDCF